MEGNPNVGVSLFHNHAGGYTRVQVTLTIAPDTTLWVSPRAYELHMGQAEAAPVWCTLEIHPEALAKVRRALDALAQRLHDALSTGEAHGQAGV